MNIYHALITLQFVKALFVCSLFFFWSKQFQIKEADCQLQPFSPSNIAELRKSFATKMCDDR